MSKQEPNLPPPPWTRHESVADSESDAAFVNVPDVEETHDWVESGAGEAQTQPGVPDPTPSAELSERREIVRAALRRWQDQLIDVSARNRLLYFRDLKRGTLNLGPDSDADANVINDIRRGRKVKLSACFPDDEGKDAIWRAQWIYRKALEYEQERGIHALRLGCLFATWEHPGPGPVPNAPVLLAPATLAQLGRLEGDFTLSIADDWEVNPSVVQLLKQTFGAEVDESALGELLQSEPLDEVAVADFLRGAYADVPGFGISDGLVLSTFAYTKEPMVRDLEVAEDAVVNHPLVAAIAGDPSAQRQLRTAQSQIAAGNGTGDIEELPPSDEFLVLDADGTQSSVINAAVSSANLVVIGPPGTGKSQTIANLLATFAARGRPTLFVAEKRAAIDAVIKRLQDVGLEDLVLDLHDGTRSSRRTAEQLGSAQRSVNTVLVPDVGEEQRTLADSRKRLNDARLTLHRKREPWAASVYDLQSAVLGLGNAADNEIRLQGRVLEALDQEARDEAANELREYVDRHGPALDTSDDRAWSEAHRAGSVLSDEAVGQIADKLIVLRDQLLPDLERALTELVRALQVDKPLTIKETRALLRAFRDIHSLSEHLRPSVFGADDLDNLIAALGPAERGRLGRTVAHIGSSSYRKAKGQAAELVVDAEFTAAQTREHLAAFVIARRTWRTLVGSDADARLWKIDARDCEEALKRCASTLNRFYKRAALEIGEDSDWAAHAEQLDRLRRERGVLSSLPRLAHLREKLLDQGLEAVMQSAHARGLNGDEAAQALKDIWTQSVLDELEVRDPLLISFRGDRHDATVRDFREADAKHIELSRHRIMHRWAEAAATVRETHPEQWQRIARQASRRRGHASIRDLFQQAPDVLTALKPCWVMSPLVVAQLLPLRDEPLFDVVVFDEASQIPPADAVSSLLRGRQAIVAGDPEQLPPTTFFDSSDDEESQEDDDEGLLTRGMESILGVMHTLLPMPWGSRTLGWHYRSKDERLIAFSNHQVYEGQLTTFPGALPDDCLTHVEVPVEGSLPQVTSSYSPEVAKVVDLILDHAANRPNESLGVIALGTQHADRIAEELRLARRDRPELDDFFSEAKAEPPFFVKNLERVQGDERDAIILTVGYSRTISGQMRYQFGPINQEGGYRRLNVAVTRAKRRMTVVSCFSANDMDPDRLTNRGVRMLRDYIEYAAAAGRKLSGGAVGTYRLNAFEFDIKKRLEARGLKLQPQYGVSGYRIDFAAMHPDEPGRPILAIEADGAQYHSAQAARDRDRLRQENLERLGWRFHRIWSTEWFRNPELEADRAAAAYEQALAADRRGASSTPPPKPSATVPPDQPPEPAPPPKRGSRPRIQAGKKIDEYSPRQLIDIIRWLESDGRLRTEDELLSEAMQELGFKRRGTKIVAALRKAIAAAR